MHRLSGPCRQARGARDRQRGLPANGRAANTRNDAADMAAALKRLGFEVLDGIDLDKAAIERKIREFAAAARRRRGRRVLLRRPWPQVRGRTISYRSTRSLPPRATALDFEMVRLISSANRWSARRQPTSCSSTPAATIRWRATWRGPWARARRISATAWPRSGSGVGTLISFSTQPGNVALDGGAPQLAVYAAR